MQRIAYLSRTSPAMIYKNYLKKDEIQEEEPQQQTKIKTDPKKEIIKSTPEQKEEYYNNRTEYYKNYYKSKKDLLLEKAKENDKKKNWMRITRELNQNKKDFEKMKPETIEKYKIKWDSKRNQYISLIDPNY